MAFLDNSGDIILDAVLTDTGRLRLAQGDGSFKISKFALGDDEINYGLYNKNHASGSAYFDLEILQTPILEAFTNNSAQVKSHLMTMSRTNVLYMPILKLNTIADGGLIDGNGGARVQIGTSAYFQRTPATSTAYNYYEDTFASDNKFYVAVDDDTFNTIARGRNQSNEHKSIGSQIRGLVQGYVPTSTQDLWLQMIRVDQGLDTNEIAPSIGMDSDLLETAYIVEMDYRLGRIKEAENSSGPAAANKVAAVNFIDDDNIATYYLTHENYVDRFRSPMNNTDTITDAENKDPQVFAGPRGSTFHFRIQASAELQSSTYLFEQLGEEGLANASGNILGFAAGSLDTHVNGKTLYYIDSTVRVVGANTGYRLDIPVRYVKIQ
jgi:hypothetical protein